MTSSQPVNLTTQLGQHPKTNLPFWMATKSLLTSSTFDDQLWRHSPNKYDLCPSLTFRPRPWPRDSPRFRSLLRHDVLPQPVRLADFVLPQTQRPVFTSGSVQLAIWWETHAVHRPKVTLYRLYKKRRLVSLNTAQSNNFKLLNRATCKIALVSPVVIQKRKHITTCYTPPFPYQPDC